VKKLGIILAFALVITILSSFLCAQAQGPSDWAVQYVSDAISAGYVPEELQSDYTSAITRKEFAGLAVRFMEKELGYTHEEFKNVVDSITEGINFTDTDDEYVITASKAQVVNGVGGGLFDPDSSITREQAAAMLARVYNSYSNAMSYKELEFADKDKISDWAVSDVKFCVFYGIMNGVSETEFDPQGTYTREQSLTTFVRLDNISAWEHHNNGAKIRRKLSQEIVVNEILGSDINHLIGEFDTPYGKVLYIVVGGVMHAPGSQLYLVDEYGNLYNLTPDDIPKINYTANPEFYNMKLSEDKKKITFEVRIAKSTPTQPIGETESAVYAPGSYYYEANLETKRTERTGFSPIAEIQESKYAKTENWVSKPEITKEVDTFYIYPTSYMDFSTGAPMFCPLDNKSVRENVNYTFSMQATAFSSCTNVFAPYYRQLNMATIYGITPDEREKLLASTPKEDIFEALDYYFENLNGGRPFILASHSQGSQIMTFVLSEYMKAHPEYYERMVAAYVLGYSITKQYLEANPHLKFAEGADDTGVIISWNTEGEGNKNKINFVVLDGAISINPLNWKRDNTYADKEQNLGAYGLNEKTGQVEVVIAAADAKVDTERGVVVTHTDVMEPLSADSGFGPESYHMGDFNLWYFNIRQNAENRIAKYLAEHK
jgi:hypothetical protein